MEIHDFRMKKNQAFTLNITKPTVLEFTRGVGGKFRVTLSAPQTVKIEPEQKDTRKGKKHETSD